MFTAAVKVIVLLSESRKKTPSDLKISADLAIITRKSRYRKDERAMRPYECPENCT